LIGAFATGIIAGEILLLIAAPCVQTIREQSDFCNWHMPDVARASDRARRPDRRADWARGDHAPEPVRALMGSGPERLDSRPTACNE